MPPTNSPKSIKDKFLNSLQWDVKTFELWAHSLTPYAKTKREHKSSKIRLQRDASLSLLATSTTQTKQGGTFSLCQNKKVV
jgi:hypothetical protein